METVSKNRGRPPAFSTETINYLRCINPHLTSARQLTAKGYEIAAVTALHSDGAAVRGVEMVFNPHGKPYLATVLEQLGRLKVEHDWDNRELLEIARIINQRIIDDNLDVREAVALLRVVRKSLLNQEVTK